MARALTAMDKEWETEEDLRTLIRAAEIKKDKDRMKRVRALAQKQKKSLDDQLNDK